MICSIVLAMAAMSVAECPDLSRPDYVFVASHDPDGHLLLEVWLERAREPPTTAWTVLFETSYGVDLLELRRPPRLPGFAEWPEWYWDDFMVRPIVEDRTIPGSPVRRQPSSWYLLTHPATYYVLEDGGRVHLGTAVFAVDRSAVRHIRLVHGWPDVGNTGFDSYCGGLWLSSDFDLRRARIELPPEQPFLRGDVDPDGAVNLADAVTTLRYLFAGETSARLAGCLDAADADDSGVVDVSDAVYTLDHLFRQGPPLAAPFGTPGLDPTPDALGVCEHETLAAARR